VIFDICLRTSGDGPVGNPNAFFRMGDMSRDVWSPSRVGTVGAKDLSEHSYEELVALHAVARILVQPESCTPSWKGCSRK